MAVNLDTLRRFSSEGYGTLPPEDFTEASAFCREWGINHQDMRFVVLESCFDLSGRLWSPGEGGEAHTKDANALLNAWKRELPGVLATDSVDEAVILAQHLQEEIRMVLASAKAV